MMVVGVVLDKVLGLHQSSLLLTPHQVYNMYIYFFASHEEPTQVSGMTGDWPVAAALHTYQSGGL